jgi:hypothetical protein
LVKKKIKELNFLKKSFLIRSTNIKNSPIKIIGQNDEGCVVGAGKE